ncbi:hypothetical protein [Litoribrevibacter albus]|uniref:Uncharacterized protein n=1 Tax=Litoribrevibacter albus TaxID=1473156 RepID=A0AA37W440_9GAMM|nr:hypothetical protein [Litoribrevibacter albus]GLQ29757.1 hypothetical protein GCM10007876_02350 [Litoribrevibacter albus]
MDDFSIEEIWAFVVVGIFLVSGVLGFIFRKISVDYIEEQMAKEGKEPPLWDKGIGARVSAYATLIIIKRYPVKSFIDSESILRFARKKDWYLAVCFISTLNISMVLAVVFYFLYGPTE